MFKRYVKHIQAKEPHHRRQHAAQIAGIFTALAFVIWVTTLGVRYSGGIVASGNDGFENTDAQQTQLAGVAGSDTQNQSGVEVVGTSSNSVYSSY
jgi:hypothetical protein